jgi:hypothetical protein
LLLLVVVGAVVDYRAILLAVAVLVVFALEPHFL